MRYYESFSRSERLCRNITCERSVIREPRVRLSVCRCAQGKKAKRRECRREDEQSVPPQLQARGVGEAGVPREGLKAAATHGVLPVCWTRK